MGKPPGHDDESGDERGERSDDPDRAAILARRQRFIALALSGLAVAACDKPNTTPDKPGGNAQEGQQDDGADPSKLDVPPATPTPCLEVMPTPDPEPGDDAGLPQACLKIAAPPEPEPEPQPQPCLRVRPPEPDPKPQPCLRYAKPPEDPPEEPAKPRPCLKIAKPR